jgi:hypothetical protein
MAHVLVAAVSPVEASVGLVVVLQPQFQPQFHPHEEDELVELDEVCLGVQVNVAV